MSLQSYTFQPLGPSSVAGNYIEGFLIGTKQNQNKWQVSKETLPKLVKGFEGTPFIIIPEKIAHNIDAHYHGATKEDTIEGYKTYSHGTIEKVLGPFPYNDGTDDFYYKHITKLSNSKAASILNEYGSKSEIPFAVSPHIWQEDNELTDYVKNFVPIGMALVHKGAYGDIAVINKMCTGTKGQCHKSLGAANQHCGCCQNTDENIAKIVSSHFSKAANLNELSTNTNISNSGNNTATGTSTDATGTLITYNPNTITSSNPTVNPQNTLTKEPQKDPNQIVLTKEQYDAMTKQLKDSETFKSQLESLQNERNIEKVTQIFSPYVTDENVRNSLIEKYKANADLVKDFWSDIDKNIIPSIKESVKAELQKETSVDATNKTVTAESNKSKGASIATKTLRPEPKVTNNEEQSKTAAAVTQNINEPKLLRKYLFGESD